jgi:uncharacterized membrane protein
VEAYNNKVTCRTNSALRLYNTNKASFYNNTITSEGSGGAGIEIQKFGAPVMNDIKVYNNVIYKTALSGIWIFGSGSYSTSSTNVHIHHNRIYDTGTRSSTGVRGGIVSDGFNALIENNVIDGGYGAGIAQKNSYSSAPSGSGFVLTLRNNIISNTRAGPGVSNALTSTHSFSLQNNCFFGNAGGDCKNVKLSPSDIKADPQYVNRTKHDYRLKSKAGRWNGGSWVIDSISSPCIDAGYTLSDYSREPENNGNRINIGPDGNTNYASKSETSIPDKGHAPVIDPIPKATVETGKNLNFTVKASDSDGDKLTYSVPDLPAGVSFNGESGFFSWTPADGQEGSYSITFEVSDGKLKDSEAASINVVKKENFMNLSDKIYDNRLRETLPETVYSDKSFLDIGGISSVDRYRDIAWFDISEYNNSAEISSAIISLFWYYPTSERVNDTVIEIYRPASTWNSSYVSWNNKDKNIAWDNPGGDWYDKKGVLQGSTPYATLTLKASDLPNNSYCELNITDLVREYVSGKYANTGFLIKARNESENYIAFYSSEGGNERQKPKLTITKKPAVYTVKKPVFTNTTIAGAKDNLLRETAPENVFPDKVFIDLGGKTGSERYRDIMSFNLGGYTNAAQINKATLALFWYYPASPRAKDTVIEIYRPASAWNSSYVSWNKKNKGVAWKIPGGDWYDKKGILQGSTPYTTLTVKASALASNRYCEFNVTDLVKEYASGKYANTGFLIKARTESENYIAFYSAECGNKSQVPKLNIEKKL